MKWLFHCPSCGAQYAIEPGRYLCDRCASKNVPGAPLNGVLECSFDAKEWKAEVEEGKAEAGKPTGDSIARPGLSDYSPKAGGKPIPLPVGPEFFPSLPVGNTPLWSSPRLREELGFGSLWLKDDTCEPSGSFKDRASFLVAAFALQHSIREVALASTGNAASSMACVGAAAGLKVTVFLPKAAPVAKRVQVLQYGAELREIDGTYDVAFDTCLEYTAKSGVLSRNTAYNPLTIEGKKTAAFEIVRDLRARGSASPDHVFVPTGDGVIIAGVLRGFEDLLALGEIDHLPTVWAAQAEGSSAIARALAKGCFEFRPSTTLADSISVDAPRNGIFALEKLRARGGAGMIVSDEEILEAQILASSKAGLFAEPSSAVALAAFMKARALLEKDAVVVIMLTGSGLKDIKSAASAVGYAI